MSTADINTFFPQIEGKLNRIVWAHAVNNQSYLRQVLFNSKIMMIEADVVYAKLPNTNTKTAIMAHSVDDPSDLSLHTFLQDIDKFNEKADISKGKGKGLKLDFKSLEAVQASLEFITKFNEGKYPFWLNADILSGPCCELEKDLKTESVDPQTFLSNVKHFSNSVLSLGWTTNLNNASQSYTDEDIENMLEVLKLNEITNPISFAVRAGLTANSLLQMKKLLTIKNSTLTIWSSHDDYPGKVNVQNLREVILDIGVSKIFVDVPKNLIDDLNLES